MDAAKCAAESDDLQCAVPILPAADCGRECGTGKGVSNGRSASEPVWRAKLVSWLVLALDGLSGFGEAGLLSPLGESGGAGTATCSVISSTASYDLTSQHFLTGFQQRVPCSCSAFVRFCRVMLTTCTPLSACVTAAS